MRRGIWEKGGVVGGLTKTKYLWKRPMKPVSYLGNFQMQHIKKVKVELPFMVDNDSLRRHRSLNISCTQSMWYLPINYQSRRSQRSPKWCWLLPLPLIIHHSYMVRYWDINLRSTKNLPPCWLISIVLEGVRQVARGEKALAILHSTGLCP
jgi:hypothetical protein